DAVVFGGDMTDSGSNTQWHEWFEDWELTIADDGRVTPLIAARGNHERTNDDLRNLFDTPANVYYAVSIGGSLLRIYTLNSESSMGGNQADWLESDLASSTNYRWRIAPYHRPMRPHTTSKSDNTGAYS